MANKEMKTLVFGDVTYEVVDEKARSQYKSEGENSFATNESAVAIGDYSFAGGKDTVAGCKGYYIKSIDTSHNKVYLCNDRVLPSISMEDFLDESFETPSYQSGDKCTILLNVFYDLGFTISRVQNNVVYIEESLSIIKSIEESYEPDAMTFRVPSKPKIGTILIGGYEYTEGYGTTANDFAAHAEGWNTLASGRYSHAEGNNTIAVTNQQHVQGAFNIKDTGKKYAHIVGNGISDENRSNAHTVDWQGNAWYKGSVTTNGADYAEYFEWLDGNPDNEDRVGLVVTLDGEKIKLANKGDEILGIISGTAAVLGDNYECEWNGKYLTDDFGRIIYDMVEEFVEIPHTEVDEKGNITERIEIVSQGFFKHPRFNPNYDPEQVYVNRADRPEWDTVGMLGKLYVRDDGTCQVNGYAVVGENGIAVASIEKTNMRVLSRVNENVVRVLLK